MATGRLPDPNTAPVTAKGDLYTYSTVPAKLAVGANGETLVADSSATTGLRWQPVNGQNYLIGGGFDIWQRGTSFTGLLGNAYGADRWMFNNTTGRTYSRQSAGLDGFQYCLRVQRDSGQTGTTAPTVIYSNETVNSIPLQGKTVTLSYYARAGANYSSASNALSVSWNTGTGTDQNVYTAGYTGSVSVVNTTVTLTTSWQRFSHTFSVASNATEIGGTWSYTPSGTAGAADYFEMTGVQLEIGSVATPFKRAGGTLAGELAACQRYYQRITPSAAGSRLGVGFATSTTQTNILIFYPVTMRTSPTALEQSGTASDYSVAHQATSTVLSTVPTFQIADTTYINVAFTVASGLTAGDGLFGRAVNTSAYLGWSAEL